MTKNFYMNEIEGHCCPFCNKLIAIHHIPSEINIRYCYMNCPGWDEIWQEFIDKMEAEQIRASLLDSVDAV